MRDAIAAVALLVSLARPWDILHLGVQRADVFAVTLLSLCTLALPYLARAGVFPATWTVHTTRLARLLGNAPYVVVALVYVIIDAVVGGPQGWGGGIGTGLALGLAGALMAAQARECELGPRDAETTAGRRWMAVAVIAAGLLVVTAVVNAVIVLVTVKNGGASFVVSVVLAAVLVVALLVWPLVGVLRGSAGSRLALAALGGTIAFAFAVGSGAVSATQVESFHVLGIGKLHFAVTGIVVFPFLGLMFLPAVAAVVAAPVVRSVLRPVAVAQEWIEAAVRSFDLVAAIALFTTVISVLALTDGDSSLVQILTLISAIIVVALAVIGRISLSGGNQANRMLGVVLAALIVVIGGVLLGAFAILPNADGAPTSLGSGAVHLVAVVGLPAFIICALTIPASVRSRYPGSPRAYTWEPPAPKPAPVAAQAGPYGQQGYPQQYGAQQPGGYGAGYAAAPGYGPQGGPQGGAQPAGGYPAPGETGSYGAYVPPQGASGDAATTAMPAGGSGQPAGPGSAGQGAPGSVGAAAPASAGQGAPEGSAGEGQPPQFSPAQTGSGVPSTQQVAGFTAEQASDPSTPLEVLAQIVQDAPHLRPQVAANPSTYPALLNWLGALGDPAVNEALRSRR